MSSAETLMIYPSRPHTTFVVGIILVMIGVTTSFYFTERFMFWIFGILCLPVFGVMAYKGTRSLLKHKPVIVITESHIECPLWAFEKIPWNKISGAKIVDVPVAAIGTSACLVLDIANPNELLGTPSYPQAMELKLGAALGLSPVSINLAGLAVDASVLLHVVQSHIRGAYHA